MIIPNGYKNNASLEIEDDSMDYSDPKVIETLPVMTDEEIENRLKEIRNRDNRNV